MALVYDPRPNTQSVTDDIKDACPDDIKVLADEGWRGDFAATWMRSLDDGLMESLDKEWKKTEGSSKYKLRKLRAADTIPDTFYRSDHASFWSKNELNIPLRAMLVTDLGPWRGGMSDCYHQPCDDKRWLTEDNLNFIKTTIDALYGVIVNSPPAPLDHNTLTKIHVPEFNPPSNITEWY